MHDVMSNGGEELGPLGTANNPLHCEPIPSARIAFHNRNCLAISRTELLIENTAMRR